MSKIAFGVCCAILWFVTAAQARANQTGCSPEELKNPLRPSDPAYSDAISLAATLQNHGFTIQCVGPSKMARVLPRQTGAALFRTSMGDFEALFRAKQQNFDDVFISEQRDASASSRSNGTGYRYTFRDRQGHVVWEMVGREAFLTKHHNILFVAWQKNTADSLTESLENEQ
jgi:hypothetical protein